MISFPIDLYLCDVILILSWMSSKFYFFSKNTFVLCSQCVLSITKECNLIFIYKDWCN